MARKNIVVGGFSKEQRLKQLEKVKNKYGKKGYEFLEYRENGKLKSVAIFEVNEYIIKKERSAQFIVMGVGFMIIAVILFMKSLGTSQVTINQNLNIISITSSENTVSINAGEGENNYISLKIPKDNIKENFTINNNKELISLKGNWNSTEYLQTDKSQIAFKIVEFNTSSKKSTFNLNTILYSEDSLKELHIKTSIQINDLDFAKLSQQL